MPDIEQVTVFRHCIRMFASYVDVVLRKSWQNVGGSRGAGRRT